MFDVAAAALWIVTAAFSVVQRRSLRAELVAAQKTAADATARAARAEAELETVRAELDARPPLRPSLPGGRRRGALERWRAKYRRMS